MLSKHLIKTVSSEISNEMLKIVSEEQMIEISEENLNTEVDIDCIEKILKRPIY